MDSIIKKRTKIRWRR